MKQNKKLIKNKKAEKFNSGIFVIFLAISISLIAFISEDNKITGFVTLSNIETTNTNQPYIKEYEDVKSLSSLAAGDYYIDDEGIVYYIDDELKLPMGKVKFIDDVQKDKHIYIDRNGNIGYVLTPISINEG